MRLRTAADRLKPLFPVPVKQEILKAAQVLQRPTSRWRGLPSFLILGTQRGGTTSLFNYLSGHPSLRPALHKEVNYFAWNYVRGESWYRSNFPLVRRGNDAGAPLFEASPNYLFYPGAAERCADFLPDVKVIALLREPARRAFSHYTLMLTFGHESLSFEAALDAEECRLAGERERILSDPHYPGWNYLRYSYMARGRYEEQLRPWFDSFPRSQCFVARSEDMYRDPAGFLTRVEEFLEIPSWQPTDFRTHGTKIEERAAQLRMSDSTAARLANVFGEPNNRLAQLLGCDLWPAE